MPPGDVMTLAEPQIRRWTTNEYHRLAEGGWFQDQRVQLIEGEILQMAPPGHSHVKAIQRVHDALKAAFGPRHWIRIQSPLRSLGDSEPEPDLAVAEHGMDAYQDHPTTALLVVEVADSSLRLDRRKAGLYAASGIAEYWIVNLIDRRVQVFRQPGPDAAREFGHRYAVEFEAGGTETIAPVAKPAFAIAVEDVFR
jgi:Uma2 family endonuclease